MQLPDRNHCIDLNRSYVGDRRERAASSPLEFEHVLAGCRARTAGKTVLVSKWCTRVVSIRVLSGPSIAGTRGTAKVPAQLGSRRNTKFFT